MTQYVGGNFNEIATQLTLIPISKDFCHLSIVQTKQILHHPISFGNKLHISIFDTVMYHLDEMTGTGRTNPLAARSTVRCFCRNTLQDRLHLRPGTFRSSGHDRRAVQRSFLSTGNSSSHKTEAFLFGQCHTPVGVLIIGITTVNQDIPFGQMGKQLFHQFIHRTAGTNHHHYFAGYGNGSYKFGYICIAFNFFPFGAAVHKTFHHPFFHSRNRTIIYRNIPSLICHIEGQILAHNCQTDKSNVCFI